MKLWLMSDMKHCRGHGHLFGILATVVCVFAALLLFVNREYVVDQLSIWQYKPSSAVAVLADRSSMNDNGKFYFYASQPVIENTQSFNNDCQRKENSTAILGCYNGRYIYIYDVTDPRLDGIREVTAAHEMLHAVYGRFNGSQKQSVNKLLEQEYDKLKNDKQFAERMAFYARTEPGERDNELHSVIGTEIAHISPELEAHYKEYFSDRSKVVGLHTQYASVFANLQSRSDDLSKQLTALGDKIERESLTYNTDVNTLNRDIEDFNAKASSSGFSSQSEFQRARSALVDRANQLDAHRTTINDEIAQYESLRQELASIASQSEALNRSIDSSLAPAPSL